MGRRKSSVNPVFFNVYCVSFSYIYMWQIKYSVALLEAELAPFKDLEEIGNILDF